MVLLHSLLTAALLAPLSLAGSPTTTLPTFNRARLNESARDLNTALKELGMVAVDEVDGLAELRAQLYPLMAKCSFGVESNGGDVATIAMDDGSLRFTMASSTVDGVSSPFVLGGGVNGREDRACRDTAQVAAQMQSLLAQVTDEFVSAVGVPGLRSQDDAASLGSLLAASRQLDHVHAYYPGRVTEQDVLPHIDGAIVDMHTDQGLFVAFTPALMVNAQPKPFGHGVVTDAEFNRMQETGVGFFIQTPDHGDAPVRVEFSTPDSIVFMMGNSVQRFQATKQFRPVPHYVAKPESPALESESRVWYGRMVVADTPELVAEMTVGGASSDSVGCVGSNVRHLDSSACEAGMEWCWNRCLAPPSEPCAANEEVQCADEQLFPWAGGLDDHCPNCRPRCVANNATERESNGFCLGPITNMYMDGFNGVGDPNQLCLVWLFRAFKMDSWWSYALGAIGAFLAGILTEWIVYYRREMNARYKKTGLGHKLSARLFKTFFYTLAVFVGYIDMLLAMTYSTLIFCMVLLGLGVGHFVFNQAAPVAESADPCCQGDIEDDASSVSSSVKVRAESNNGSANRSSNPKSMNTDAEGASCCATTNSQ